MAQNSDALQEPSMDELLASIREIIEENTGAAPQGGQAQGGDNAARNAQSDNTVSMRVRNHDTTMPNLKQDIRLRNNGDNGNAVSSRPNGYNAVGNFAHSHNGGRDNGFPHNGFVGHAEGNAAPIRGNNAGRNSRPVQDSMNALAERIGLHRNNASANNSAAKAEIGGRPYQPDNNASSLPPFITAPARNGSAGNGRPFSPANNAWPQNGGQAVQGGNMARARVNPAAAEADFRNNGSARPGRFQAAEIKTGQPVAGQPPMGAERSGDSRSAEMHFAEKQAAIADFDKNLPADVEHSTENLLRPFIAQWLDEHFRNLFEKILREEVQRFIQSMRRG